MQKIRKRNKDIPSTDLGHIKIPIIKDEGNYGWKQESYREKEPELELSATFFSE